MTTTEAIPVDLYGGDDGDFAYIPHVTRGQAKAMFASVVGGDFVSVRATRCYVRRATPEECESYGWDYGVIACRKDEPGAVAGWYVEDVS
jgi:hypothetical protein